MAANFPDTFKAYEFSEFGDPFQTIRLNPNTQQIPLEPTQVRIKMVCTALNFVDFAVAVRPGFIEEWGNKSPSPASPLRLGFEGAGVIVEVGRDVGTNQFQVGDEVFASAYFDCLGTFAEYVNLDIKYVALKSANMSFNEAAGAAAVGATSYQAIVDHGKIQQGDRVLILGGSSATGLVGIQIAKALGASHVVVTCSARNTELVKSYGADEVIDYTQSNWKDVVASHSIDLLYDCGMEPDSWNAGAQKVIKQETGRYVTIGIPNEKPIEAEFGAHRSAVIAQMAASTYRELSKLADSGKLKIPIDSVHPFEELVDAFKIVVSKRARGKVVIEIIKTE